MSSHEYEYRSAPLTAGNFKASRITITPFRHLLPTDVLGSSSKHTPAPAALKLHWRHHAVETDIPAYPVPKNGPRGFFRSRSFARLFLEGSGAEVGDQVIFERISSYEFRLHLEKLDGTIVK